MQNAPLEIKLRAYYLTAIFSLVFAVVGFSYNAWRMEVSEDNNTVRTAAFEGLKELAEFEQIVFAAHYDQNLIEGSPRKGWVKVGLIVDLSTLISAEVVNESKQLHTAWHCINICAINSRITATKVISAAFFIYSSGGSTS